MAFISSDPNTDAKTEPRSKEPQQQVILRLDRYFREAVDHVNRQEWLGEAERCVKYRDGDQLDEKTKKKLKNRGQPEVIENKLLSQIDRYVAKWQRLRTRTKFLGRNLPFDEPLANMLSDMGLWIDQSTRLEHEEKEVIKAQGTHGFGVLEWGVEHDEFGFPRVFGREEDPFCVFPDQFSKRYDWNEDARYICRAKWIDLEDAVERWPDSEMQLRQCVHLSSGERSSIMGNMDPSFLSIPEEFYIDSRRQRLRPVECWYKRKMRRVVIVDENGTKVAIEPPSRSIKNQIEDAGLIIKEDFIDEMWLGIFCAHFLIHHDKSPYSHNLYPFVPYYGYRKGSGVPYGRLLNLLSLQDEHNKRRQKALHLFISKNIRYRKGAIENPGLFAAEMARPDGMAEQVGKIEDVEIDKNLDMGQAQLALHQETRQAFDDVAANSPVDSGQAPGEVRSDRGLQRLQNASDSHFVEFFTNIRLSKRMNERLKFELINEIITEDLAVQVLDEPDTARTVFIQKDRLQTAKQKLFDLIVVDVQDHETTRSEQLQLLFNVVPNILQFGPGWVQFMLELTDLRDKDRLLKILEVTNTKPPVSPRVSMQLNWSEMSPIERAGWALSLGQQEIAQAVLQGGEPSKQALQAQVEQLKQASKERMEELRIRQKDLESRGKSLENAEQRELASLEILGNLQLQARGQDIDQEVQNRQLSQQEAQNAREGNQNSV